MRGVQIALVGAFNPRIFRPEWFVANEIVAAHQQYLGYGGLGFLLGDGRLHYGRETTEEAYYNAHTWRGLYFALGLSHIDNPGYNRDRGPVWVPSVRCHVEF